MVVPLGPGKFYGSSLPRPRIYTDVKLNSDRIDPPAPVLDPLLSWANEAHWSMGGLSFTRHRLQGRIEGSIKKLREESEKIIRKKKRVVKKELKDSVLDRSDKKIGGSGGKREASLSPPPAPIATKRRRFMALIDEDEEEEEEKEVGERGKNVESGLRRRSARKLGDDFDRVALENAERGNVLKSKMMRAAENISNEANKLALQREKHGLGNVVEDLKGSRNSKGKKLRKIGEKIGNNGGKGLFPSGGIRISPRLLEKRRSP